MHLSAKYLPLLLPLIVPVCSSSVHAQLSEVKFDHLSLDEGLSQSTVNAIVQDGQGFLWFATQDGLNRYDGYTVTIYKHVAGDSTSIADDGIWSLCKDGSGDIWIGTMRGGLNRYVVARDRFIRYLHNPSDSSSISENNVTSLISGFQGISLDRYLGSRAGPFRHEAPDIHSYHEFLPHCTPPDQQPYSLPPC